MHMQKMPKMAFAGTHPKTTALVFVGAHPVRDGFGAANGPIAHGVGAYEGLGAPRIT